MNNFEKAFTQIIGIEGGYVNDPKDLGGETNYGICKRSYPTLEIQSLTLEQAKAIYKKDYWDKVKADNLPTPLCFYVFDAAVNQGVTVAIKLLQKALNLTEDGILGPKTLTAAGNNPTETAALFMAERGLRYTQTSNFEHYGRGWLKRLFVLAQKG